MRRQGPVEETAVGVRDGRGGRRHGAIYAARLRSRGRYRKDEGLGIGGGRSPPREVAVAREQHVVVLYLRLFWHGNVECVFCGQIDSQLACELAWLHRLGKKEAALPIAFHGYTIPCTGTEVPAALA